MFEFILPDLGEGVHEGEVLKWYVTEGAEIAEDDPLVDIETDKAAVTIPSPKGGRIATLNGKVGGTVLVGQVIAVIATAGEATTASPPAAETDAAPSATTGGEPAAKPAPTPASASGTAPPAQPVISATPAAATPPRQAGRPVPAAPATRRLAREMGIDINQVPATGPGGRVIPADLQAFASGGGVAAATPTAGAPSGAVIPSGGSDAIPFLDLEPMPDFESWGEVEREPLRSIRRKVARKMTTSMILVPHVAHMDDVDVTALEDYRDREKERVAGTDQPVPTLLAFVARAVAEGLKQAPAFNASLDPYREEIVYKHYYNIGIAVDSGRGLIVPVIRDVDRKSINEIGDDIRDVAGRSRAGKIDLSELRGGTFTITNVGPLGGTALIPTINYPEVAILGMGRVQEKPVVREGEIVIRKILPLTLAFDHRVADGADAARFVSELIRQLSDPLHWLASRS